MRSAYGEPFSEFGTSWSAPIPTSAESTRAPERATPEPGDAAVRREPSARVAMRLAFALALSAGIAALGATGYGTTLSGPVTVVGYPIYADFDANHYLVVFYCVAIIFPALAIALYQLAARVGPMRRSSPRPPRPRKEAVPVLSSTAPAGLPLLGDAGATALLGAVIALEAAVALRAPGPTVLAAVGGGAGGLFLAGLVLARWRRGLAILQLLGVVATVLTLVAVSERTVINLSSGGVVHYRFFPLWLGLVVAALLGAATTMAWRRGTLERLARNLVAFLVAPIALFLVIAFVSGPGGGLDTFGEGEYLGGAYLLQHGALPWQNLYLIHGLLDDALKPLLGYVVFGDSRWGAEAGINFIWAPAYWVATYVFAVVVFGRRWYAAVASAAAIALGIIANWDLRYLGWPLLLALLAATLRRGGWRYGASLGLAALLYGLLVPEMFYAAAAVGVTLVVFEVAGREQRRLRLGDLQRCLGAAGAAGGGGVAFAIWLAATGGFSGFFGYFSDFASGHSLSGGIPLWTNYAVPGVRNALGVFHFLTAAPAPFTRYWYELVLPVVAVLVTIVLFAFRIGRGRRLYLEDWIAICASLLTLAYYPKGLSRADSSHIAESFDVAVPLLFYLAFRLVSYLDTAFAQFAARTRGLAIARPLKALSSPAGVALVVALIVVAPSSLSSVLEAAPGHFHNSANPPPAAVVPGGGTLGYEDAALPDGLVRDMARIIATYAGPTRTVFDFTNAPALFDYLLGAAPGSRFYDVNLTISEAAQQQAVRDIAASRPRLVIFGGALGMAHWDFLQNEVRDHVISRYLLTHYRPLALVDDELVMIADDVHHPAPLPALSTPPVTTKLYYSQRFCEFGYTPDFLPSPASSRAVPVRFTEVPAPRQNEGLVYKITLPAGTSRFDYLAVTRSSAAGAGSFTVSNLPNRSQRDITWVISGGRRSVAVESGACLQWYGFSRTLYLRYKGPGAPTSVSLLP